jgi:hypothetical protein
LSQVEAFAAAGNVEGGRMDKRRRGEAHNTVGRGAVVGVALLLLLFLHVPFHLSSFFFLVTAWSGGAQ